ncbi:MAG: Trk family potassium uptake protein [Clostridiales bacterium]|nr:Trk family potassium uptake protein [Clostridiales bacterium]
MLYKRPKKVYNRYDKFEAGSVPVNHQNPNQTRTAPKRSIQPEQVLALGFLVAIMLGGLLLTLPVASTSGSSVGLLGAMFTATSAVCVTGLNIVDIGLSYSGLGQGIILVLIQVGGLGFMVFATLAMTMLGKRISLRSRMLIRDSMNQNTLSGLVRLTLWTALLVFGVELAGACLLMIRFIPLYGVGKGIWFGFFHSISAFCNAGFDLLGNFTSVVPLQNDPLIIGTLILLIITGSMGFVVIMECAGRPFNHTKLSLHTKLVLLSTAVLLLGGALIFGVLEWNNPDTIGSMTVGNKLLNSLFQSTTCRTAGFCAVDQGKLTDSSKLISCILMFIGASPASTGGGVKTTTFSMVLLLMATVASGREDYVLFKKRVARDVVSRAVTIIFIMLGALIASTCIISVLERRSGMNLIDILFEVTSAVSTTGLSALGSASFSVPSQLLLMLLMYLGRVGPLTLAYALSKRLSNAAQNRIHYPEENIMIG